MLIGWLVPAVDASGLAAPGEYGWRPEFAAVLRALMSALARWDLPPRHNMMIASSANCFMSSYPSAWFV